MYVTDWCIWNSGSRYDIIESMRTFQLGEKVARESKDARIRLVSYGFKSHY